MRGRRPKLSKVCVCGRCVVSVVRVRDCIWDPSERGDGRLSGDGENVASSS